MIYFDRWGPDVGSFWDEFPQFKQDPIFKSLFKDDRTTNKHRSSKIMWFIVLSEDLGSLYFSFEDSEKYETLKGVTEIDPLKYLDEYAFQEYKKRFCKLTDSSLAASVRVIEEKLKERNKLIAETPYTMDREEFSELAGKYVTRKGNAAQLDKMMGETKKLNTYLKELKDALSNEEGGVQGVNGTVPSFLENGMR